MKVELQCGDTITIPEGCKAIVKDGSVVFEKEEQTEEKKEVQEFKDGDVLVDDFKNPLFPFKIIMIYKGTKSEDGCYECYIHRDTEGDLGRDVSCCNSPLSKVRHATEAEKEELFDLMKEKGLRWNAGEKRVEKIRWRSEKCENYYFLNSDLSISIMGDTYSSMDDEFWGTFNYFRTEKQAEEAAKRVKEALRKYHEEIGE